MYGAEIHYNSTPRSWATFFAGPQLQQPVNGGLDEVDRIGAAVRLGQDVVDAAADQHFAHAGARLDAGAGPGRNQNHPAAAETADDAMRNRLALPAATLRCRFRVSWASLAAFSTAGGTSLALP